MTLIVRSTSPTKTVWHIIHYDFNLVVYNGKESHLCGDIKPGEEGETTAAKVVEAKTQTAHTKSNSQWLATLRLIPDSG